MPRAPASASACAGPWKWPKGSWRSAEAAVVWVSLYIMRTLWKGSRRRGFASYSRPRRRSAASRCSSARTASRAKCMKGLPSAARPSRTLAAQRSRPSMPSSAVPPVRGASSSSSECARIPRWRASAAGAAAMPCLKMHASFPHGWTQIVTTGQNL